MEIGCNCAILFQQSIEGLIQWTPQGIHQIGKANCDGTTENGKGIKIE